VPRHSARASTCFGELFLVIGEILAGVELNQFSGVGATQQAIRIFTELKIESKLLISSNVHVEADMDHSDSIWDAIADHVKDEYSYQIALEGAQTCAVLDRAFRVALAHEMLQIDK
jgi:hypothetical protein